MNVFKSGKTAGSTKIAVISALLLLVVGAFLLIRMGLIRMGGAKHPDVMLVVMDTTRADHLGVYGYERSTSPVLDAFARENVLFKYAVTAAPWTPPSVATMFTGMYPVTHGVMPPNSREQARKSMTRLSDKLETMAEFFKAQGYVTGGITPNPWTKEEFGYNQGFDVYAFRNRAIATDITDGAIRIIDRLREKKQPIFMYVHYLDPHDPYTPPKQFDVFSGKVTQREYDNRATEIVNKYDGEILYMDTQFGRLIDALKQREMYDGIKMAVLGDHGEQFYERGDLGHGYRLHNEELHVPLFIRNGEKGRVVDFTVSTVDVFPTLIDAAGFKIPAYAQGVSLLKNENARKRFGVLSEIRRKYNQKSITTFEGQKLIVDFENLEYEGGSVSEAKSASLFDRHTDYPEKNPIQDEGTMKALMSEYDRAYQDAAIAGGAAAPPSSSESGISDDTIKQLKSLGYLQ